MTPIKSISDLLHALAKQRPVRSGSLIISVFGDTISQHGGSIWLGSLIEVMAPFGLNERLVRTAVYRLVQEGWLVASKLGRRSYYRFTPTGLNLSQKIAGRIYAAERASWNNEWTLVIPVHLPDQIKDKLKKDLSLLGFVGLTTGVYAHPGLERRSLNETIKELGVEDDVIVMKALTEDLNSLGSLKKLSYKSWDIATLEGKYKVFLEKFRPVMAELNQADSLSSSQCFHIRTLVIHEYRRILLKDFDLPLDILPDDWAGQAAFHLRENIYKKVYAGAEQYIIQNMESSEGPLPKADASFYERFGGLKN